MTEEDKATCREFARIANKRIEELAANKQRVGGAVNWADLGVRSVAMIEELTDRNETLLYWEIRIEEASPDATELHEEIRGAFNAAGFESDLIEVRTEW